MRFRSPSALTAAFAGALALAGCDTTEVVPPAPSGPTVQFATSSVNASEGGTATLPVVLSGGTGAPVTVEVLFAAGASSATLGEDFSGFGADDGGLQIATVTFAGAAQDTAFVTFEVADEGAIEGAEEAVFALQQAEGDAIGETRTLAVVIGTLPLAELRARPNLETVTAEGVVTRAYGRLTYLQDDTGAIAIFAFDDSPFGEAVARGDVGPGDRIQVTGKLCEFGVIGFPDNIEPGTGLKQITAPRDQCFSEEPPEEGEVEFEVLVDGDEGDVPAPQTVTLSQIVGSGDVYESELVRVTDLTIDPAGDFAFQAAKSYTVTDATGSGILRTPSGPDTQIAGVPIPTGPFTFEGIIGQFRLDNQLTPIYPTDVIPE
jgi:hypothetical protein